MTNKPKTLDTAAAGAGGQYLTFMLAGEEYGVDILRVQEINGFRTRQNSFWA
jgi:chemotaxis signal transduction protein